MSVKQINIKDTQSSSPAQSHPTPRKVTPIDGISFQLMAGLN
jgi:hypothetical protein